MSQELSCNQSIESFIYLIHSDILCIQNQLELTMSRIITFCPNPISSLFWTAQTAWTQDVQIMRLGETDNMQLGREQSDPEVEQT